MVVQKRRQTIFGKKIISPTNDEFGDEVAKLLELLLAFRFDGIAGVCISATDNMVLEVLAEIVLGAEEIGICEVEERKIF